MQPRSEFAVAKSCRLILPHVEAPPFVCVCEVIWRIPEKDHALLLPCTAREAWTGVRTAASLDLARLTAIKKNCAASRTGHDHFFERLG